MANGSSDSVAPEFIYLQKWKKGLMQMDSHNANKIFNHLSLPSLLSLSDQEILEKIWTYLHEPRLTRKTLMQHITYINQRQTDIKFRLKRGEASKLAFYIKSQYIRLKGILPPFDSKTLEHIPSEGWRLKEALRTSEKTFRLCMTIVQNRKLHSRFRLRQVKAELTPPEDDSQELYPTGKVKLSLLDPISLQRIKIPLRSTQCAHLECFDLETFLIFNKHSPRSFLKCPICHQVLGITKYHAHPYHPTLFEHANETRKHPMEVLVVDGWMQSLLDTYPADEISIDLSTDSVTMVKTKKKIYLVPT